MLIVRARATERKAPFKLLQLASLIIFSSMVIIVVGIMFIPFTGKFQSVFYGPKFCSKSWGLPNYSHLSKNEFLSSQWPQHCYFVLYRNDLWWPLTSKWPLMTLQNTVENVLKQKSEYVQKWHNLSRLVCNVCCIRMLYNAGSSWRSCFIWCRIINS